MNIITIKKFCCLVLVILTSTIIFFETPKIYASEVNTNISIKVENNALPIYKLQKIDFANDSVIPVPDSIKLPTLESDFFYRQHKKYKINYSFNNWQIGFINQEQNNLVTSPGLIEFINNIKDNVVAKDSLAVGYFRNETKYKGQEISYQDYLKFNNSQLLGIIKIKYLQGINYYREKFAGVALPRKEQDAANHDFNYNLYGDAEIYKTIDSSTSLGYGLDIKTKYLFNSNCYIKLELVNLIGQINWSNIEHETGQISTNNAVRDSNGNIDYTATMKGREEIINLEQQLPKRVKLILNLQKNNLIWQPQLVWEEWEENNPGNENSITSYLKMIYLCHAKKQYYLNFNPKHNNLSGGIKYNNFKLEILSDHYHPEKVESLGFALTLDHQF